MLKRKQYIWFYAFISIIFSYAQGGKDDPFWGNQIETGVQHRNTAFTRLGLEVVPYDFSAASDTQKKELYRNIASKSNNDNAWDKFICGMLINSYNPSLSDSLYQNALINVSSDAGGTWILFLEFLRNNNYHWAENCLYQLEKLLFQSGGSSAVTVSEQLKNLAFEYERKRNPVLANNLYKWAERFNADQIWSMQRRVWVSFPLDVNSMSNTINALYSTLSKSWLAQFHFAEFLYSWLRLIIFGILLSVFFVLSIKHFPSALHKIADIYPFHISVTIRTLLASALLLSTVFLGIYVLLWLIAFLLWNYLEKSDKFLMSGALVILILAPIDARFIDSFNAIRNPDCPIAILKRAVNEGYSKNLEDKVDFLKHKYMNEPKYKLAAALCDYKKGDFQAARLEIDNAIKFDNSDPLILQTAGNIAFQQDSLNTAKKYYEAAFHSDKKNVSAIFNLGQCLLRQTETIKATEIIDKAAKEDPFVINNFIHKNDHHFSKNWPPLRCVITPDYTSSYFWKKIFFSYSSNWESASIVWGTSFFGFNPKQSMIIFSTLFVLVLLVPAFRTRYRIKTLFECRHCGRIVCRRCADGILCKSCNHLTGPIKNDKKIDKIRLEIFQKFMILRFEKEVILDILFPGCGSYQNPKKSSAVSIILIFTSAIVYSTYFFLLYLYNQYTVSNEIFIIFLLLFVYNLIFSITRISDLLKYLKSNSRN